MQETIPLNTKAEALRYTFLNAKLDSFEYGSDIGNNKSFSASFSVESYPEADQANGMFTEGLFISGVLGMEKMEDFILLEGDPSGVLQEGYYLQQEDDNLLVTNILSPY